MGNFAEALHPGEVSGPEHWLRGFLAGGLHQTRAGLVDQCLGLGQEFDRVGLLGYWHCLAFPVKAIAECEGIFEDQS